MYYVFLTTLLDELTNFLNFFFNTKYFEQSTVTFNDVLSFPVSRDLPTKKRDNP